MQITMSQTSISGVIRRLKKVSDWIDNTFFPVPATERDIVSRKQQDIEACSNLIYAQIAKCKTLKDTYDATDAVRDFMVIWGNSIQVMASVDSMNLALYNKQKEIMKELCK